MAKKSPKKSPKPQKAKKNHIFSNPQPRVRTIKELLDVEDLSTLSWQEQAKLARYTNRQAKKLMREYNMTAESWKSFITPESQPNAIDAFEKLMKQQEFINWKKVEEEVNTHKDEYEELSKVMEDKDKWTILRRLAAVDPRMNIDRAYASETLREIEDMIESGNYRDIDAITDEFMLRYYETKSMNEHWDESLHEFATSNPAEDAMLYANTGFHGVEKAKERYEREKKRDLSGYAPMWQSPMWFEEV